jgi:ankyrin repeat protein
MRGVSLRNAQILHGNDIGERIAFITRSLFRAKPTDYENIYDLLNTDPISYESMYGTPLHLAAYLGSHELPNYKKFEDIVKKYLVPNVSENDAKYNANFYIDSSRNPSPLIAALGGGNTAIVKMLLENGADVNKTNKYAVYPIHLAIFKALGVEEGLDNVSILIQYGADINSMDRKGYTPLHVASQEGEVEVVKFLIDKRANINAVDHRGRTPLHLVAEDGFIDVVKLLMYAGADISVRDESGITALDLAREAGHTEIADAIIAEDMIRLENRNKAGRIEKGRGIPTGLISQYLAFGRTKGPVSKKKSVAKKTGLAKIKKTAKKSKILKKKPNALKAKPKVTKKMRLRAKKMGIKLTVKRNGLRVRKTPAVLMKQIKRAMRKKICIRVTTKSNGKRVDSYFPNK